MKDKEAGKNGGVAMAFEGQEEARRTRRIRVRLTRDELAYLQACAEKDGSTRFREGGRINLGAFCRKLLLAGICYGDGGQGKYQDSLEYQVRKIGVNINQAARRLSEAYGMEDEAQQLLYEFQKVEALTGKVIDEWGKLWNQQS